MVPLKRHSLVRRHEAQRPHVRSSWPRHARGGAVEFSPRSDHDMLRGLSIGLPLGLAIWLLLGLLAWWIV